MVEAVHTFVNGQWLELQLVSFQIHRFSDIRVDLRDSVLATLTSCRILVSKDIFVACSLQDGVG